MTDLCYLYKCGKCDRTFNTPDQLKNHQMPCRGKKLAEKLERPLWEQASGQMASPDPINVVEKKTAAG